MCHIERACCLRGFLLLQAGKKKTFVSCPWLTRSSLALAVLEAWKSQEAQ